MKLPKIKISKLSLNSTLDNELFLTDTDDIGFARNQINQIDHRIKTKQVQILKPWERSNNNNIYSSLNKFNNFFIKNKKKKIRNNSLSFNWNNQNIFNKTDVENIKRSEEIKKQMKIKYDTKYKYKEPTLTVSNFISTRNEIFITNKMIDILKEEKKNIMKKTEDYEKSLKYENKSLDKDIDKFNDYMIKMKKKIQENELLLLKIITDNKTLVDLYKKQLQEYNSTVYEIYKYIKLINSLKHYAFFIHKLLGGDNDILHCDLIEHLNFNEFKNQDVLSITQNIIKNAQNIINDNNLTNPSDDLNLNDLMTIDNFDLSFKSIEERIIKIFIQKEKYISEKEDIIRKGKLEKEEKNKKYDSLHKDYQIQLEELNEKIKDYNKAFLTPGDKEIIEFNYELLKDIYYLLFGKSQEIKELKVEIGTDMCKEIVSPILKEIYKKEEKVNNLIKIMEQNENENKNVFNKVLNRRKMENRAFKLFNEKDLIKFKENLRIQKYNNKMKKVIIKGRYKYNPKNKPEEVKPNLKRVKTTEMNINDFNLLYYK